MRVPFSVPSAEDRRFDILAIGQNSVDLVAVVAEFPESNSKQPLQRFARLPGGEMATAAAVCARLGWRAGYLGIFGDDELGRMGRESLAAEGVALDDAKTMVGTTSRFAIILVDARSGDRTVLWDRDPALALQPSDVNADTVRAARVLIVDALDTAAVTDAARVARAAAVPTVLDIERVHSGTAELLKTVDAIVTSQAFPAEFTGYDEPGRGLQAIADDSGAALVCMTLGPEGSLARCHGREFHTPAFIVDCVDTTGAGDAFRGGLAAALLAMPGGEVDDVLRYANAVAGLNCRGLGARGGMPTRAEVERLLMARSRSAVLDS